MGVSSWWSGDTGTSAPSRWGGRSRGRSSSKSRSSRSPSIVSAGGTRRRSSKAKTYEGWEGTAQWTIDTVTSYLQSAYDWAFGEQRHGLWGHASGFVGDTASSAKHGIKRGFGYTEASRASQLGSALSSAAMWTRDTVTLLVWGQDAVDEYYRPKSRGRSPSTRRSLSRRGSGSRDGRRHRLAKPAPTSSAPPTQGGTWQRVNGVVAWVPDVPPGSYPVGSEAPSASAGHKTGNASSSQNPWDTLVPHTSSSSRLRRNPWSE